MEGRNPSGLFPPKLAMYIYFVRHGETIANKSGVHQDAHDELSDTGRKQSQFLAESLKRFPIETIIASPFKRTHDTAEIIQESIQKPLAFSPLLQEIPYPSQIQGLKYNDPTSIHVRSLIEEHAHEPRWHYSDEENFIETCNRARRALDYIRSQSNPCVLVVTHGRFLLRLLAVMLYDNDLNLEKFQPIPHFFEITNTGITIVEKNGDGYKLLTWNDYAHLKELTEDLKYA